MKPYSLRGRRPHPSASRPVVALVNPLGGALAHYTTALAATLTDARFDVRRHDLVEPSRSSRGRIAWIVAYCRAVRRASQDVRGLPGASIVVTWPVLGFLDVVLHALLRAGAPVRLVMHDPDPLVRAVGYSRLARSCAALAARAGGVLVHSLEAQDALGPPALARRSRHVPHPVKRPTSGGHSPTDETLPASDGLPAVRVLGQYKRDRDVILMTEIAARLAGRARFEVYGRGWPPVEGWTVVSGFLAEEELERLISTSRVVLIPYRRFFQSGIAVRCLESRVPFVGPRVSSLEDLSGHDSELLVDHEGGNEARVAAWTAAVSTALTIESTDLATTENVWARGADSWRRALLSCDTYD